MLVVSNTSPLSNLAAIGRLELVREQLGEVMIPPAVQAELDRNPKSHARAAVESAKGEGWIRLVGLARPVGAELVLSLDLGEAEAISLALETKAGLVLLDESAARLKAGQRGLRFTGVLGILRYARIHDRIPSLQEEIKRLRREARFFISPVLEKALLLSVGE